MQVCWPACAWPSVALCALLCLLGQECICRALFSSVIKGSLSLSIYIYICLLQDWCLLITLGWCKVDGKDPSGLHVLCQVLHCVPCCVCLVKSASVDSVIKTSLSLSVELCFLLLSRVSLSLYIYIYACCRIGVSSSPLDGAKLMAKTQACMCFAKCCIASLVVFNCLVKSASVDLCFLLLSSGLSLYIYIYACCRIGVPSSPLDGAKLMAKTQACMVC